MGIFHKCPVRRLRNLRVRTIVLVSIAGALGAALIGCAEQKPHPTSHLPSPEASVVRQAEKQVQAGKKKDVFAAAEEIVKGKRSLQWAQQDLQNNRRSHAKEMLLEAKQHFLNAEKHGEDISHLISQVEDLYKELVQADFDFLKLKLDHDINNPSLYESLLRDIAAFENRLQKEPDYINKGNFIEELYEMRGHVHTAFVEYRFDFARHILEQGSITDNSMKTIINDVNRAINFMEANKSHDLGLDVHKLREEGNHIIGQGFLKAAQLKIRWFKQIQKVSDLQAAQNRAKKAQEHGVDASAINAEITGLLNQIRQ